MSTDERDLTGSEVLNWKIVPGLTRPMFITLVASVEGDPPPGRLPRQLYLAGQMRLIRTGLYRRGLIDEHDMLTGDGWVAALTCDAEVRRAHPGNRQEATP